jgi:hypothetical protein
VFSACCQLDVALWDVTTEKVTSVTTLPVGSDSLRHERRHTAQTNVTSPYVLCAFNLSFQPFQIIFHGTKFDQIKKAKSGT